MRRFMQPGPMNAQVWKTSDKPELLSPRSPDCLSRQGHIFPCLLPQTQDYEADFTSTVAIKAKDYHLASHSEHVPEIKSAQQLWVLIDQCVSSRLVYRAGAL